ncbi:ATP-binding protein [Kitasatospora sp. NPDC002227]|uniref:sensor histidine kinase n=1 Tax=Kitasatospora sp. NPDC002227 TaxID=3154773 RepID=UPI00331ED285
MTAPIPHVRGAYRRLDGRTVTWAVAGILVGAGAGAVAVATAAETHRAAVAATAFGGFLLWCVLAVLAAAQAGRVARTREGLEYHREEAARGRVQNAELRADLTSAHASVAALRSALAGAESAAEAARADLTGVRAALVAAEAANTELGEFAELARADRAELDRIAGEVLPEVVQGLRGGRSVETVLAAHRGSAHAGLLRYVAEEVGRGERQRAAALAVCATAAGRVQALATSMHAELREMQHRHGEDVLGDLLTLDHSTAQAGRLADSIAVLTGARSGRRWAKPISVESILRGALGRIGAYQRVRLHSASTAAVAGYAAEGVMHALAELLDNATNFSAPPAEVHVYVEEAHAGLVITVEDGGLGLSDSWLSRAERAVSPEPLDLTALSAGTRIGLAVVGSLARKHGLSISFRPSARGGTGVVMLIPAQLITHPGPEAAPAPGAGTAAVAAPVVPTAVVARPTRAALESRSVAEPSGAGAGASTGTGPQHQRPSETGDGSALPQRRRGQTLASAQSAGAARPAATAQPTPPRPAATLTAARFGAFRRALQPGPDAPGPDTTDALPKDDA